MKLSLKIIRETPKISCQDSYRGTYYYGKISVPLSSHLDNYSYYNNITVAWFNDLTEKQKNRVLWNEGIIRFIKKWQAGDVNFKEFYTNAIKDINNTPISDHISLHRFVPLEYVLAIFPVVDYYRVGGNCKWRSPSSILNRFFSAATDKLVDIRAYPGGFITRDMMGSSEIIWKEFNDIDIDLGERGEDLVGFWRRELEAQIVDSSRKVIYSNSSEDVDSFEYFLLQKLKLAYVLSKTFPEYFSKIYPSA